jgi:hypothetical protein
MPSDVPGFKEQNTGNTSTDTNVKEHVPQVTTSSVPLELPAATLTDQPTTLPLESSASTQGGDVGTVRKAVPDNLPT